MNHALAASKQAFSKCVPRVSRPEVVVWVGGRRRRRRLLTDAESSILPGVWRRPGAALAVSSQLYREALKTGFFDLQAARDRYREIAGSDDQVRCSPQAWRCQPHCHVDGSARIAVTRALAAPGRPQL